MRLNREELLIGLVWNAWLFFVLGWWASGVCLATAVLWALGGAGYGKWIRRWMIPALTSFVLILATRNYYYLLSIPLGFGVLTIGYGRPDINDQDASPLGTFYDRLFRHNQLLTDCFTRGTIWVLWVLCYLVAS